MKLINHDLKDKWILDSGATNHMTGNPELLDCTTCLVPSISVYLGNNERLISIPVLVVPGLNVNLISCANCALTYIAGFYSMYLEVTPTTKEETRYSCSKLLETYLLWS